MINSGTCPLCDALHGVDGKCVCDEIREENEKIEEVKKKTCLACWFRPCRCVPGLDNK